MSPNGKPQRIDTDKSLLISALNSFALSQKDLARQNQRNKKQQDKVKSTSSLSLPQNDEQSK